MFDRQFLKQYRDWLLKLNNLRDCLYKSGDTWNGFSDYELAQFRRSPKLPYVERWAVGSKFPEKMYRGCFAPTLTDLHSHTVKDYPLTMFCINSMLPSGLLLMLADLDNKTGGGDVDRAASHLAATYSLDSVFVDPSTGYQGRHVYFLLDTSVTGTTYFGGRDDLWSYFDRFSSHIAKDNIWKETGVKFDGFYGLPTMWEKDGSIRRRGNALKLPRMLGGSADLDALKALKPISYERLLGIVIPKTDSSGIVIVKDIKQPLKAVTSRSEKKRLSAADYDLSQLNGEQKKARCVSLMLRRSNGEATLEEIEQEYLDNWEPTTTGDTLKQVAKRQRQLQKCLDKFLPHFVPKQEKQDHRIYPFVSGQFLPLIQSLAIPETDYHWNRREKLTPEKLADFISLKVADAFYPFGHFAQTKRDTTISNSRTLKASGKMSWTLNNSTYQKLLEIGTRYQLLEVFRAHTQPVISSKSGKRLADGTARLIGPGIALPEARKQWLPLYQKYLDTVAKSVAA